MAVATDLRAGSVWVSRPGVWICRHGQVGCRAVRCVSPSQSVTPANALALCGAFKLPALSTPFRVVQLHRRTRVCPQQEVLRGGVQRTWCVWNFGCNTTNVGLKKRSAWFPRVFIPSLVAEKKWTELDAAEHRAHTMRLLDGLEVIAREKRLKVARAILYMAQGQ